MQWQDMNKIVIYVKKIQYKIDALVIKMYDDFK